MQRKKFPPRVRGQLRPAGAAKKSDPITRLQVIATT